MDRIDQLLNFLNGKDFANTQQWNAINALGGAKGQLKGGVQGAAARFAGSKAANNILRVVPGLTAGLTALDVADILTNDTSIGNKGMDAAAMAIGGALGAVGGPMGAMGGASLGKLVSDGTQFVLGGGKSPEQRKLEEALIALKSGGMI